MRAVYLKSMKSPPVVQGGKYKLQYNWKNGNDDHMIFSQTVPDDYGMSEYEEDSFCVPSDQGLWFYTSSIFILWGCEIKIKIKDFSMVFLVIVIKSCVTPAWL